MNIISKNFVIVLILLLSISFSQNSPTSQSTKSINIFYDGFCRYESFEMPEEIYIDDQFGSFKSGDFPKRTSAIPDTIILVGKTLGTIEDNILANVSIDFGVHGVVNSDINGIFTIRIDIESDAIERVVDLIG